MNVNTQKIVESRNKKFKAAKTNAERRVLIAKDVIEQIKNKLIIAEQGEFVQIKYDPINFTRNRGIREAIIEKEAKCTCCALGSLMVSCTLFNNHYTVGDLFSNTDDNHFSQLGDVLFIKKQSLKNGLDKYFSKSQLRLIEIAFESGNGYFGNSERRFCPIFKLKFSKQEKLAEEMFSHIISPEKKLISVMKNIIKNKGKFIPE